VTLREATEAQHRAVARLLGRPARRGTSLHVSLPAVEAVLRGAGLAPDLTAAVQALGGPVTDRAADRSAAEQRWAAVLAIAERAAHHRPALAPALAVWAGAGQPVHLTACQLLRDPPDLSALRGRGVFVCENPSVIAEAANRLGAASSPLICANAHPGAAATVLLRQLGAARTQLRYHGDFDWPGITIANGIIARFGAFPWRLDADAYLSAAQLGSPRLRGTPVTATWDPCLTEAMLQLDVRSRRSESSTTCSPTSPTANRR
jgi:hypothetical protein